MQSGWQHFSTESVMPTQRVSRWTDFGSETFSCMDVEPLTRAAFRAALSRIEFGPLGLIHVKSTAAIASSRTGGGGDWAVSEKDALVLSVPGTGHCTIEHNHSTSQVRAGDLFIRDLARPWTYMSTSEIDSLMVKIPYSALLSRVDNPGRLVGATLSANEPVVAMVVDVIRSVNRLLGAEPQAGWHATLADLILDGVRLLYQSSSGGPEWRVDQQDKPAIRREAMNYILRNLENPCLSVATIAQAVGVGSRRLQRAFVEAGESPSQFILTQRLDRAARELTATGRQSRQSITEVAFSVGFSDASHFSRAFSRRFGMPPRMYRRNH